MDKNELVAWLENHEIAETLRSYIVNNLKAAKDYKPLADLATKGEAIVKIKLKEPEPYIHCLTLEAYEQPETTEVVEEPEETVKRVVRRVAKKA